jgi:hypothetical protein
MHEAFQYVMAVVSVLAGTFLIARVLGPFASAIAKRLEGRAPTVAPPDPAIDELREEVDGMQERLDFLERALVAQKNPGGRALSAKGERTDPPVHTPS